MMRVLYKIPTAEKDDVQYLSLINGGIYVVEGDTLYAANVTSEQHTANLALPNLVERTAAQMAADVISDPDDQADLEQKLDDVLAGAPA